MSDSKSWLDSFVQLPKSLLANRPIVVLLFALTALEYYNAGLIPALVNREKAIETAAIADNAKLRQQAEAAIAEQKSLTAAAIAANAPKKQAADARKAKAGALKAAAEAEIAQAKAGNSAVQAAAAADAQTSEARITEQQTLTQTEISRQIARKLRAELEIKQINLATDKVALWFSQFKVKLCTDCDPNYCILCERNNVPDLPSGAELPPPEPGEPVPPPPLTPKLSVLVGVFPWQAKSTCDHNYDVWRATLPYGAFTAGCYYSAGQPDIATARRKAVEECSNSWARSCAIVAEITADTPPKPKPAGPPPKPILTRIHRDPFPLGGGCRVSFDKWTTSNAFGAFAVSARNCGFETEADDLETAKQHALANCGDRDCYLVFQITAEQPAPTLVSNSADAARGKVVPVQLNVHSKPSPDAESIIGKLDQGQVVVITGKADGDFITIEATCNDGKPCKGYVNGRSEFIAH